jgi:hypothetical protein
MWNSVFVSLAAGRTSRSCLTAGRHQDMAATAQQNRQRFLILEAVDLIMPLSRRPSPTGNAPTSTERILSAAS